MYADHILSYFLSGDGGHPHVASAASTNFESVTSDGLMNATTLSSCDNTTAAEQEQQHSESSSWLMPPPTPAVQFYSQHTKKRDSNNNSKAPSAAEYSLAGTTSQSSSSSSLSSMAATLVHGVINPMLLPFHGSSQQQQHQLQEQQRSSTTSSIFGYGGGGYTLNPNAESPISPAAMIGNAQENLLLPQSEQHLPFAICEPTPRVMNFANAATTSTACSNNSNSMGPPQPRPASSATNNSNNHWPLPFANPYMHPHLLYTVASLSRPTVPETVEKRAKRLERNRMSARKSRRKKKERLDTLGAQVNDLHIELELERRKQIDCMVPAFEKLKLEMTAETMDTVIKLTEPNNFLHRAILDFQYTQLKSLTMAPYQRFLMWLLLQPASYFRAVKEVQIFQKLSSKQIGEQLTVQTAPIHDPHTAWPLFCFELKFSVDQEDRFVAAMGNQNKDDITTKANQIQMAVDTADRLCKAMGSLSHMVAKRQRQTVLTFAQRQILRQHAQRCQRQSAALARPAMELSDICRSLESVLHISNVGAFESSTKGQP
jgi:bZIP transcription factor